MTETRTLPLSAFTAKEAKPAEPFGQLAKPPLSGASDEQVLLLRAAIPSDIPSYAVVTSAEVRIVPRELLSGSHTLTLKRNTTTLRAQVKYNNIPTVFATASATLTRSGSAAGVVWPLVDNGGASIASDVQGFIAGTLPNYGWRLSQDVTTVRRYYGATAAENQPVLVFTYAIPGDPPTDLMPTGGAVSVAKPVLTFTAMPGTVAIQVQIDPASDGVSPDWESAETAAVAGVLDLSTTDYPGLADGATTTWRARYEHADTGWSDWSDWYEFSREDQPALAIVTPDSTPGDGTPVVSWTFPDQAAWRVRLLDAAGKVLANSGEQSGTDAEWQPAAGLTRPGQVGTIEVSTRDTVVRVATPGAPTWVTQTLAVTFTPSDALVPFDSLYAYQDYDNPVVHLSGTRLEGIPDEVVVYRQTGEDDEVRVARVDGIDVFTGTAFAYSDPTAPPNKTSVYRVVPVTDGDVGADSPEVEINPVCTGLWLIDPDDLRAAVLYGQDDGSWETVELASEHQPANGETIRRREFRLPPRGEISGDILDTDYQTADETMATLDAFAEAESEHVYQFVVGHENLAVRVNSINHRPTPLSSLTERMAVGSWSWRATRDQ